MMPEDALRVFMAVVLKRDGCITDASIARLTASETQVLFLQALFSRVEPKPGEFTPLKWFDWGV